MLPVVNGESNCSSGELLNGVSLVIGFLASAGDFIACAGGVDPLGTVLAGASLGDA